jgi:antitoxin VapB
MGAERHVKLFRNGRNRAVRIPREFDSFGDEAIMRQEGDRLVLEPTRIKHSLAELLDRWATEPPIEEEWPEIEDAPPGPVEF